MCDIELKATNEHGKQTHGHRRRGGGHQGAAGRHIRVKGQTYGDGRRSDVGWWTCHATYRWRVLGLHAWHRCDFINQCRANKRHKQTSLKQNAIGTTLNAKFWPPPKTKPDGRTETLKLHFPFLIILGYIVQTSSHFFPFSIWIDKSSLPLMSAERWELWRDYFSCFRVSDDSASPPSQTLMTRPRGGLDTGKHF